MKRRICYVSGTRADFGLMTRTLQLLHASRDIELGIAATGMHFSDRYGGTISEIEHEGLTICARIRTNVDETTGFAMAEAIGQAILGLAGAFAAWQPDLVLLLGDRGEMLAGAIAAIHLNVPVAHVHGGERSGTVDEPIRHAISKLSHYHLAATSGAKERLVRMGENPRSIFVTGAPGLDGLSELAATPYEELYGPLGLDPSRHVCLVVFHPVVQEAVEAAAQTRTLMEAVLSADTQIVAFAPNADAGGGQIRSVLSEFAAHPDVRFVTHLGRRLFVSWMACADAIVGNSSAGIIEAPTLGLWAVNVGSRQNLRERNGNVIDVPLDSGLITAAVRDVLGRARGTWHNVYGDGHSAARICALLERLPLDASVLKKTNAY